MVRWSSTYPGHIISQVGNAHIKHDVLAYFTRSIRCSFPTDCAVMSSLVVRHDTRRRNRYRHFGNLVAVTTRNIRLREHQPPKTVVLSANLRHLHPHINIGLAFPATYTLD